MTGYHAWVFSFLLLMMHLGFFIAGTWSVRLEVRALASEIWGDLDGAGRSIRRVGKGAVYWGWPLERVLQAIATAGSDRWTSPARTQAPLRSQS